MTRVRWLHCALFGLAACSDQATNAGDVLVVHEVTVDPPSVALSSRGEIQLEATPLTASGLEVPNREVVWLSRDPGIATVSSSGLVTAERAGRTEVIARVDEVEAVVPVSITLVPVAWVVIDPAQVSLELGDARQLEALAFSITGKLLKDREAVFTSDKPWVAAVTDDGMVVAAGPGQAFIRARIEGKEGTARVTVTP